MKYCVHCVGYMLFKIKGFVLIRTVMAAVLLNQCVMGLVLCVTTSNGPSRLIPCLPSAVNRTQSASRVSWTFSRCHLPFASAANQRSRRCGQRRPPVNYSSMRLAPFDGQFGDLTSATRDFALNRSRDYGRLRGASRVIGACVWVGDAPLNW